DRRLSAPDRLAARERPPASWRLAPRCVPPALALGNQLLRQGLDRVDGAPDLCEPALARSHPTLPRLATPRLSPLLEIHDAQRKHLPGLAGMAAGSDIDGFGRTCPSRRPGSYQPARSSARTRFHSNAFGTFICSARMHSSSLSGRCRIPPIAAPRSRPMLSP